MGGKGDKGGFCVFGPPGSAAGAAPGQLLTAVLSCAPPTDPQASKCPSCHLGHPHPKGLRPDSAPPSRSSLSRERGGACCRVKPAPPRSLTPAGAAGRLAAAPRWLAAGPRSPRHAQWRQWAGGRRRQSPATVPQLLQLPVRPATTPTPLRGVRINQPRGRRVEQARAPPPGCCARSARANAGVRRPALRDTRHSAPQGGATYPPSPSHVASAPPNDTWGDISRRERSGAGGGCSQPLHADRYRPRASHRRCFPASRPYDAMDVGRASRASRRSARRGRRAVPLASRRHGSR